MFQKNNKFMILSSLVISITILVMASACNSIMSTPTVIPTQIPTAIPTVTIPPVDVERKLTVGGLERSYFLHIPQGLDNQKPVPLVFVFHGFREISSFAQTYSGLDRIANANGFIVVYPNGSGPSTERSWNGGGCCGYANENNVDEPAFIRSIITDVQTFAYLDTRRIYAAGFSNGALLSYRLACEMSDTFAAIAPIAGVLLYNPCQPGQPVSVIDMQGLKDNSVPFEGGGLNPSSGEPFPPVKQSVASWAKLDGCTGPEKVEQNGGLTHTIFDGCKPGVAVELYTVSDMGHEWPPSYIAPLSQTIWDFFAAHPKALN